MHTTNHNQHRHHLEEFVTDLLNTQIESVASNIIQHMTPCALEVDEATLPQLNKVLEVAHKFLYPTASTRKTTTTTTKRRIVDVHIFIGCAKTELNKLIGLVRDGDEESMYIRQLLLRRSRGFIDMLEEIAKATRVPNERNTRVLRRMQR